MIPSKMDLLTRCYMGGGSVPSLPPPPKPPAPPDAGGNVNQAAQAEKKRQGFQSTILTGGNLGNTATTQPTKTLLGS